MGSLGDLWGRITTIPGASAREGAANQQADYAKMLEDAYKLYMPQYNTQLANMGGSAYQNPYGGQEKQKLLGKYTDTMNPYYQNMRNKYATDITNKGGYSSLIPGAMSDIYKQQGNAYSDYSRNLDINANQESYNRGMAYLNELLSAMTGSAQQGQNASNSAYNSANANYQQNLDGIKQLISTIASLYPSGIK